MDIASLWHAGLVWLVILLKWWAVAAALVLVFLILARRRDTRLPRVSSSSRRDAVLEPDD